jgi:6-pyruvoyltetrahydropterin/6-carboxytetrahydropterin synthase
MVIRVTKEFHFEMAHALLGHDGPCRHIHGHSYRLFVTLRGVARSDRKDAKDGMLMDFSDLKKIVNEAIISRFDHSLVLSEEGASHFDIGNAGNLIVLDNTPTCENLVVLFAEILLPLIPANIQLFSLKLHETASSFAAWHHEDQHYERPY